ncbi:MAG: TRAP transporter substrate-binding protein DctP [Hyphomicrobiaceae bacterium]
MLRSMMSKVMAPLALALMVSPFATSADAQQTWTLKYGHVGPATPESDDQIPGEFLKAFLEPRSQGRIKVEIYPASQLGNFRALIEQVQLNTLELTHTTVGGMAAFFPELQVTDIPYLIPDDLVAERLAEHPFFDKVRDAILKKTGNVRLIAVGNTGRWRSFFTTKKLVKTAADMRGVKMRIIDSPLHTEFIRSLGGNPTFVAWGELYTALRTGVVEGTMNAATDIIPNNMHEATRFVTLDEHMYLYGFWWISDKWLQGLPADLKALVIDGIQQASVIQSSWNKQYEARALAEFQAKGGTIYVPTAEEKATFTAARDAMKKWFVQRHGETWMKDFETAIADVQAAIAKDRKRWGN